MARVAAVGAEVVQMSYNGLPLACLLMRQLRSQHSADGQHKCMYMHTSMRIASLQENAHS